MVNLQYGNGNCSIDGNVRLIQINYTGKIQITDKTSSNFVIMANDHKIIIYPIGSGELTNLFNYIGEFKVISARAIDMSSEYVYVRSNAQIDYTENISTYTEDITRNIEDLNGTYINQKIILKTLIHPTQKEYQVMSNEYFSKAIKDQSVDAAETQQNMNISRGTSY